MFQHALEKSEMHAENEMSALAAETQRNLVTKDMMSQCMAQLQQNQREMFIPFETQFQSMEELSNFIAIQCCLFYAGIVEQSLPRLPREAYQDR